MPVCIQECSRLKQPVWKPCVATAIYIPGVIKTGQAANKQYLLLEWIEKGQPADRFWENFARDLAGMHQKIQPYFGWVSDNYIGRLKQRNKQEDTWDEFYTEHRIMPLCKRLSKGGYPI
jgi:fructosamine-3-kinase